MDRKMHYTLWTGGWDSTFRVVELSRQDVIVQPVYVIDDSRKSSDKELQVMEEILRALRSHPGTRAELRDVMILSKQEIPADPAITAAFQKFRTQLRLGGQYDWLARLAKQYPGIEIGVEKTCHSGRCQAVIREYGKMMEEDGLLRLDPARTTEECFLVLGNFVFPIYDRTEEDMLESIRQWGYEDIMRKIWFCHNPIGGKACGMCNPCRQKMEGDMKWLLPEDAQKRFYTHTKIRNLFGIKVGEVYRRLRSRG